MSSFKGTRKDLFKGTEEAQFNEGGIFFLDGSYVVRVDRLKVGESRKDIPFFVAECTVIESSNPGRKPGTPVSYMAMAGGPGADSFLGNCKHVCSVVSDTPFEDVDQAGIEECVSDDNPCAGTLVRVTATMIKTKKGTDFTKVVFKPLEESVQKKYQALADKMSVPDPFGKSQKDSDSEEASA